MTLLDNLVERSADILSFRHNTNFEPLHLRYLSFEMRQFMWKAVLFDPLEFKNFRINMDGPNSVLFRASRNEAFILHEIQRMFSELPNWTGDLNKIVSEKSENILVLKEVLT